MKRLLFTVFATFVVSDAIADVPFKEHLNGDLTVKISKLTKKHIKELEHDIPGNQGKCVRFQIMEFQDYEMNDAIMRIPAKSHGIEFESHGDGNINIICARFTEDYYNEKGKLDRSVEYEEIEGY
ncbi:hypothetical protein MIC97_12860 [Aquamicrobium sp. NLF2-7]|uniref:hypothetical protein n=1 Tax=Aquamicrobium sp. NLF2-7 TaxID=2918753 RepID=UPI001EFA30C1|nr:hypothetical protein [Aquamicrobium sp. NLF2-7]MCG8272390.1 hypothetical protein [Aquamicrobium sp. NLF2-7]